MGKFGKAQQLNLLGPGEILGRTRANALIKLYNAFVAGRVVEESPPEILVSDKCIVIKIGDGSAGSSGGGGGTDVPPQSDYAGIYVPGQSYDAGEWVLIQAGPSAGSYISLADNNNNDPTTGINWVQFASLSQWF